MDEGQSGETVPCHVVVGTLERKQAGTGEGGGDSLSSETGRLRR